MKNELDRSRRDQEEIDAVKRKAKVKGSSAEHRGPLYPEPIEEVMAEKNETERHNRAIEHLFLMADRIRDSLGTKRDISDLNKLPHEARTAIDTSINAFRRNDVLTDEEITALLEGETPAEMIMKKPRDVAAK